MNNDLLKVFETESDYDSAKPDFVYPTVSYIKETDELLYMAKPNILDFPIKAVFYDSSTGSFVKLYPDQITEAIPTYTPIGVEVVPAEHDVYGTGQAGIMSLAEMNRSTPDVGSSEYNGILWGGYLTDISLPNLDRVNLVNGTTDEFGHLPSDQFTGDTSLDDVSNYYQTSFNAPSPFNADGSRNEAYYTTTHSTANALSDFDGVGNTTVLTDLATKQSDWKTASTIKNNYLAGSYPAACCCWRFHTAGTDQGQWYLPACGEMGYVINRISAINETINKVKNVYASVVAVAVDTNNTYWSSSEVSAAGAWHLRMNSGYVYTYSKNSSLYVRAFLRV